MITLDRVYTNVSIAKDRLDSSCNVVGCVSNFEIVVSPNVVWGVITSPEEQFWLNNITDILQHAIQSDGRKIALIRSVGTSLSERV